MRKLIISVVAVLVLSGCGTFRMSSLQLQTAYLTGETKDKRVEIKSDVTLRGNIREIGLWFKEVLKTANDEYIRK